MPKNSEDEFLADIKTMVESFVTPYELWKVVPKKYKKDFDSWCIEYKQQSWKGMWDKGWYNYGLEYIAFLLNTRIEERR